MLAGTIEGGEVFDQRTGCQPTVLRSVSRTGGNQCTGRGVGRLRPVC